MNSFFTTVISSDITTQIPFFLDSGLSVCPIHAQTHFWVVMISKLHFKHFSELSKTSSGHPKKISPYCYGWGLSLSGLATYWLWLRYKVCHASLVMNRSISQCWYHMYDTWLIPRIVVFGWVITRIAVLGFVYFEKELQSPQQLYINLSAEVQVL